MATSHLRNTPVRANPTIQPVSLALILNVCCQYGLPVSRFGREAVKDPRLVHDMRLGRELRTETLAKVASYISALEGR